MKKPFYKSKTLLGILIAALPQIAQLAVQFAEAHGIAAAPATSPEVAAVVTLAGLVLAAYGRLKAKGEITVLPKQEFPKEL